MYFEIFRDPDKDCRAEAKSELASGWTVSVGNWRWRLNTGFGDMIACAGSYDTQSQCEDAVSRVKQTTTDTEVLVT